MDHFERNGLHFDVLDSGPDGASAVVLLHGFPQQPTSWDDVAGRLQADGLRTLVPTQRGYTAAARPTRRRDYTTAETAADVVALLDSAGIDHAHIVGHDWGGTQAWGVAGLYPERVTSLTVLSTPHPAAMMKSFRTSRQGLKSWYVGFFQLPLLPEVVARRVLAKSLAESGLPAERIETYAAAMAEPGALTGALNWYRGIPFSTRTPIGAVRVPTSYIWGRHDSALGRTAAELTASYVTGPYAFIELDSGHWLPETDPVEVANAIGQRVVAP
ncbi:MAG TPA: alpha/beta fold hydrolase [Propionibacteriaceae bacterium]|nr:alpha/beta fold hydrolase [Propionibacteriaceae bacterium]